MLIHTTVGYFCGILYSIVYFLNKNDFLIDDRKRFLVNYVSYVKSFILIIFILIVKLFLHSNIYLITFCIIDGFCHIFSIIVHKILFIFDFSFQFCCNRGKCTE